MKLYTSALSPFARKCEILARAKNIDVEMVAAKADGSNGYGSNVNPMGKIPFLVRDGAEPIYDSVVICEYLDSLNMPWLALRGDARWRDLRLHRTGDGLAEAIYNLRYEMVRDEHLHWGKMIERHETAIHTIVKALNAEVEGLSKSWNFATISLVCALDYADFRAGDLNWRKAAPELAAWHKGFETDPLWAATNGYT